MFLRQNIVKYIGSFKSRTHLYIILEYMENGALSAIIKPNRFGVFPETLVAVYIAQVLQGLQYLHEQGVVHRDIKGANILTTKEVGELWALRVRSGKESDQGEVEITAMVGGDTGSPLVYPCAPLGRSRGRANIWRAR